VSTRTTIIAPRTAAEAHSPVTDAAARCGTQETLPDKFPLVETQIDQVLFTKRQTTERVAGVRSDVSRVVGGLRIDEIVDAGVSCRSIVVPPRSDSTVNWLLVLQLDGQSLLLHDKMQIPFDSGDILLVGPGLALSRKVSGRRREVCVCVPRAMLEARLSTLSPPSPCLIRGSSGIGIALTSLVCSLVTAPKPIRKSEEASIRDVLINLAAAAYASRRTDWACRQVEGWTDPASLRDVACRRLVLVQHTIEERLQDPGLNLGGIAALHRISSRHLQRLFHKAGTSFGNYVKTRRLERCREELLNPRLSGLSLTDMAYRWGFSDSSHFSRCFKAHFGYTARDFRARADSEGQLDVRRLKECDS